MTVTKMRIPGRPSLGLVHTPRGKRTLGDPASLPRHRGRSKASVLLLALARTYAILAGMAILSSPRGRGFDRARAHFLRVRWARHFLGRVPDAQQNHVRDPPLPRRHSRRSSGSRAERCRVTSVRGRPAGVSAWTQHPRSPRYGRVHPGPRAAGEPCWCRIARLKSTGGTQISHRTNPARELPSTAVSDPSPAAQQGLRPMFRMEQRWWPANSPARWKDAR